VIAGEQSVRHIVQNVPNGVVLDALFLTREIREHERVADTNPFVVERRRHREVERVVNAVDLDVHGTQEGAGGLDLVTNRSPALVTRAS
jgi:hypothetical protein